MSELVQSTEAEDLKREPERFPWVKQIINGEEFMVKQGMLAPLILNAREGSRDVVFSYTEYHHEETNMQISVLSLGLNQPKDNPAIVRADYGCPCMGLGSHFTLPGHDCAKQRELTLETIATVGVGAIATVAEQTAAGNGHGSHVVMEQLTLQWEAIQNGQPVLPMQDIHAELGYFDDKRRHDLVASVLSHTLGDRPAVPATSNMGKIQVFKDAGMNVVEGMRVDLITDRTEDMKQTLRRDGYHKSIKTTQPGAYLVHNGFDPVRLTRETYQTHVLAPRRLVN